MSSPFPPDWVLEHAERNPEAPAVDSHEARLSYGELAERIRRLRFHGSLEPELLEEVFELNMQLQELKMGRDPETIENLNIARIRFEAMLDVLLNELMSLWNHWDAVISQPAADEGTRIAIRDKMVALLNRRNYVRNLVRDVNEALS